MEFVDRQVLRIVCWRGERAVLKTVCRWVRKTQRRDDATVGEWDNSEGRKEGLLSLAVMGSISSQRKISLFPEGSHEAGPCTHPAEFAPGLGAKFSQIARAKVSEALPLQMTP